MGVLSEVGCVLYAKECVHFVPAGQAGGHGRQSWAPPPIASWGLAHPSLGSTLACSPWPDSRRRDELGPGDRVTRALTAPPCSEEHSFWGVQFTSVQSLSHVRLSVTPWIIACQASLSITSSQSSLKLTSIESVMPSSHLILCRSLLLLPPIPPSIRVFSNESTLPMRWPKYWSFSFSTEMMIKA